VRIGQPAVVLAHRSHRPGLHLCQPLTAGEHRGAGLGLHHRPQRLLDQVTDLATGPVAVVHLDEPVVDDRLQTQRGGQRVQRAFAPQ
jgi:hypothetical protein